MTGLDTIIRRRIAQTGPITLAEYMELYLSHPRFGYYQTRDPLGAQGDFTTAPEISQMFGELIGLWLAQVWIDQGAPSPFILAELGPGRGTLMADVLRATSRVEGFHTAAQLWLVETSPVLRKKQAEVLAASQPNWANSLAALPGLPLFLVANEFFDALPVRQFVRGPAGWHEKMVGLMAEGLVWALSPALPVATLDRDFAGVPAGVVVEMQPASRRIAEDIGARIEQSGGAALIIDYGDWHGTGDTLQALQHHRPVDPLHAPGQADLTTHVNFSALAAASGLHGWPMQSQGRFLELLGVSLRSQALQDRASNPEAVVEAYHRLTHESEMGTLFKVLCLTRADAPEPPGFAQ